jgi:hypothetical protein
MTLNKNITVFWDVMTSSMPEKCKSFRDLLPSSSSAKMEPAGTLAPLFDSTQHHISEHSNLHIFIWLLFIISGITQLEI